MSEQPLSPQGYNIKDRPVNANPFWQTTPAGGEPGGGSQSLDFTLLGTYLDGVYPPDDLVIRMREYPVVGFGVAYHDIMPPPLPPTPPPPPPPPPEIQTRTSTSGYVTSHDIQALIPTRELTTMSPIRLSKTLPAMYGCNVVLCVTVIPQSNGTRIFYDGNVKYMAGLTRIVINGKTYYVNATTKNPASQIHFGLCVWGVRLKEGSTDA